MRILRMAAIATAAVLSIAAGKPQPNWTATVTVAENGTHTLGNPQAPVKLTEYVSYTCPHCATFQQQAEAPLRLAYVTPGKVSVTVHHFVRDPVDMTVAMLINCGDAKGFFERHNAFLRAQDAWLGKATKMSEAQQQRWSTGTVAARLQAVASDLDLYQPMTQRGFTRSEINRCLSDEAMARKLTKLTQDAVASGVKGTPSFALNGTVLPDTHDWQTLDPQIRSHL